jgi:hypothetical protein
MAKRTVSKAAYGPPSTDALAGQAGRAEAGVTGPPSPDTGHDVTAYETYGISGLARYGAISRVYEEFLRELQGPQGMKNYREMMDNDPVVGAILFAANHLCRKVSFRFKPANDTQQAKWVAAKVGSMIFDDMDSTWPETLSEILTMLPFGWALMEWRIKRRLGMSPPTNPAPPPLGSAGIGGIGYPVSTFAPSRFEDGLIGFRSWSLRSQETLFMWEFDTDSNATVMQQMAPPDYRVRRIPMTKAFLFRTQVAKNNPEGRSIIRNCWPSYYIKKNLQVIEGIGVERELAGYPVIKMAEPDTQRGLMPPDIWNPKKPEMVGLLAGLKQMVRSVRMDEQMGMVLPWWADFKLVSTGGRRNFDTNGIIGRYDQRIAMSVMADFIMLGHEAVGSKALASTKISLFTSALSSFLDNGCAVVNRHAVPTLMQFNGWPQELAPVMEHGDVESVNLQELGAFIRDITGKNVSGAFDPLSLPDVQAALLQTAKLPTAGIKSSIGGVGDAKMGEGDSTGGGGPVAAPEAAMGPLAALSAT